MCRGKMKLVLVLWLAIQMVVPLPLWAAAVGQFTSIVGDVQLMRDGAVIKPRVTSPLQVKDLIVTGADASAALLFDDESTITLAANSRFEVKDFSVRANQRQRIFSLVLGKLTANVKRFIGGANVFEVHSQTAVAGVRGTVFSVAVGAIGGQMATTVTCSVGSLSVSALSVTGAVVATSAVVAGQTAVVTAAGITVSATAAGAAAAGAMGAESAGAAAGGAAAAGVGAGTIAVGVAAAAVGVAAVVEASSGDKATTTHHHHNE